MDTEHTTAHLAPLYYQCKAARRTQTTHKTFNVGTTNKVGTSKHSDQDTIGSFDTEGDTRVMHTHIATRHHGHTHQNISASFDPSTLTCISCDTKHSALHNSSHDDAPPPSVFAFTDQSFPPVLKGSSTGPCIRVLRLEDGTLGELADLVAEVFGPMGIPPDAVLMMGSASHLLKAGSSCYAGAWVECTVGLQKKFPNLQILPLIPIPNVSMPGKMYRYTVELAIWLEHVYGNSTVGLGTVWKTLIRSMTQHSTGHTTRHGTESYTLPFPGTLSVPVKTVPFNFHSEQTVPQSIEVGNPDVEAGLVLVLIEVLNKDFSARLQPDGVPRLAAQGQHAKDNVTHCVIIGASHMKRVAREIAAQGLKVTDMSVPGWVANSASISALSKQLDHLHTEPGTVVVLDLLGNSSTKFLQIDDTLSMPCKIDGKWHLLGDVKNVDDTDIGEQLRKLSGCLTKIKDVPKVFIPPIPRYVFGSCCSHPDHAPNVKHAEHQEIMLKQHTRMRNTLKRNLHALLTKNFRVLDFLGSLSTRNSTSMGEHVTTLMANTDTDYVHLTPRGYTLLACAITQEGCKLLQPDTAKGSVAGDQRSLMNWRGFVSTTGIGKDGSMKAVPSHSLRGGRQQRALPYVRR
jgi:lysophospholipase L1-like esterase